MTSPTEPPFAQPTPWQPGQPAPPEQPPYARQPPQPQWQSSPPAPKASNGLAITALVVACVALVMVLGVIASMAIAGAFSPSVEDLQGTAPQVVAGEPYPGDLLAREVTRVINADGGDVSLMNCPRTPVVEADAVTVCNGVVDSFDTEVTVTFHDDLGHFTLLENDSSSD